MQVFADQARTTLATAATAAATTLTLESGAAFPLANRGAAADTETNAWFKLVLIRGVDFEICYVCTHAAGSATLSNVLRGQDGTTARAWVAADTTVVCTPVASDSAKFESLVWKKLDLKEVITPTNVSPANDATNIQANPVMVGSDFYSLYSVAQSAMQIQISTDSDFLSLVYDSGDLSPSANFSLPRGFLEVSSAYYWRLRYKNSRDVYSDWSLGTRFTTVAEFGDYIERPAATPEIGAAFEGGFYAGMIWNEVTQSTTSMPIGVGEKTFVVPDMAAAPIFYEGQSIEVRHTTGGNSFWFAGTVKRAIGTNLTVDVNSTSVATGTFATWSVMARFRIVVAPKASGDVIGLAMKNVGSMLPSECATLTEGYRATEAMRSADSSTVYPAAHWARNLSIGGRTDWYLPARDELELLFRNLKPSVDANYTTANRSTSAVVGYGTRGAYNDVANTHGLNQNSAPKGAAYTSATPGQTGVAAFKSGGTEALQVVVSGGYFSCTDLNTNYVWTQTLSGPNNGMQSELTKGNTTSARLRAVRRSII